MTITVTRDLSGKMRHIVAIGAHSFAVDQPLAQGGEDTGPTPHDLYDSAVGTCNALTMVWYAQRKGIPVEGIQVTVDRDVSDERNGIYRLRVGIVVGGPITDLQRMELLRVAEKCPVHKLMTQVTTEIVTVMAEPVSQ